MFGTLSFRHVSVLRIHPSLLPKCIVFHDQKINIFWSWKSIDILQHPWVNWYLLIFCLKIQAWTAHVVQSIGPSCIWCLLAMRMSGFDRTSRLTWWQHPPQMDFWMFLAGMGPHTLTPVRNLHNWKFNIDMLDDASILFKRQFLWKLMWQKVTSWCSPHTWLPSNLRTPSWPSRRNLWQCLWLKWVRLRIRHLVVAKQNEQRIGELKMEKRKNYMKNFKLCPVFGKPSGPLYLLKKSGAVVRQQNAWRNAWVASWPLWAVASRTQRDPSRAALTDVWILIMGYLTVSIYGIYGIMDKKW